MDFVNEREFLILDFSPGIADFPKRDWTVGPAPGKPKTSHGSTAAAARVRLVSTGWASLHVAAGTGENIDSTPGKDRESWVFKRGSERNGPKRAHCPNTWFLDVVICFLLHRPLKDRLNARHISWVYEAVLGTPAPFGLMFERNPKATHHYGALVQSRSGF